MADRIKLHRIAATLVQCLLQGSKRCASSRSANKSLRHCFTGCKQLHNLISVNSPACCQHESGYHKHDSHYARLAIVAFCCLAHTRKDLTTNYGERAALSPLRCGGTEHLLTKQYRRLHAGSSMGLSAGEGRYAQQAYRLMGLMQFCHPVAEKDKPGRENNLYIAILNHAWQNMPVENI